MAKRGNTQLLYHTISYYIILYHTISYYIIIYIRIYIYCYLYHLFGVPALRQFHSASGAFWIHNSWARNRLKLCDFGLWMDCILGWHSWWISALVPWQTTKIWQISARHGMFRDVQRRLGTAKFMYFVITYDYPINSELEFRIVFFPVRSIFFQSSSQLGAVHPFHALRSTTFEPGSSAKSVVAVWSCLRLVTSRIAVPPHFGIQNLSSWCLLGVSNQFLSAQWAPFADFTQHQVSPSGQTLLHQAAQNEQHALEVQHTGKTG